LTYNDAVQWSIDNVPMDFYDSYDEWFDAIKAEIQTPELLGNTEFNSKLERVWENEVGDITKSRKELEREQRAQKQIEQFEEPQVQEPSANEIQHELERNLPPEQQSKDFIRQEKVGALSNVIQSLPKGTEISIPQAKGAPIRIKPSVLPEGMRIEPTIGLEGTKVTRIPRGAVRTITMVRPPTTPAAVGATVQTTFRQTISTTFKTVTGGVKKALGSIRGLFRI
jgi:hypothetical protein